MPPPDGPMRSLATLGEPPILLGGSVAGIPLSRLTDAAWRSTNDFSPPAQAGHAESSVPLSRLTDVLWRDANAVASDEQGIDRGAPARAWSDRDNNVPRIVVRPWPLEPPMTPDGGAESVSYRSASQSPPNIEANIEPALPDDRFDLREQGERRPEALAPTYDGSGNLAGDGTYTFGDDVEDRLVPASWSGVMTNDAYGATGRWVPTSTTPLRVIDADNREVLEYDADSRAPRHWHAHEPGPNLNQMDVVPGAGTTSSVLSDIRGPIISTVDSGTGALTEIDRTPRGISGMTRGNTDQRMAHGHKPGWGRFTQVIPVGPPPSRWAGSSPWFDAGATVGGADSPTHVDVATVWHSPADQSSGAIQPAAMLHDELQRLLFGQGDMFGGGGWQGPGAPILPPFIKNGPTSGVLRSPGKPDFGLVSVYGGAPASRMPQGAPGFDLLGRSHVEGHAAALMREHRISQGTLYINNPKICDNCARNLPAMLPPGATLDVVLPTGIYHRFIGAVR